MNFTRRREDLKNAAGGLGLRVPVRERRQRDQSLSILREFAASDEKVKIVNFSRNFGHEAAMIAGLDYAGGDGIVCMDADLQHPPECLPEIVEKFDEGYEVISMVRTKNKTAGFVKNFTSAAFYKLINHLSDVKFEANASDFSQ